MSPRGVWAAQTHSPERAYRTVAVPVAGGELTMGVWDAAGERTADVLLVHGVTSSHLAWPLVVRALPPGVRAIAPDLRGRGRSNAVTGPAGLAAHADDLAAVLEALGVAQVMVVGHSMGAFVAAVLAQRHPERVSRLVFVDGGLPLDVPAGMDADEVVARVLGPTAERLRMRFADADAYLDFWRGHPAFAGEWTPELEEYFRYDLAPDGERWRPATSYATTVEDTLDLLAGSGAEALAGLRHPALLLTVPRGLRDETPGLYEATRLERQLRGMPRVRHERLDGYNHYTIVLTPAGAADVAARVTAELAL